MIFSQLLATLTGLVLFALTTLVALSLLLSLPVWLLWNYCLVGAIDGVQEVSWLQAWGINLLCGLLFKTNVSKEN